MNKPQPDPARLTPPATKGTEKNDDVLTRTGELGATPSPQHASTNTKGLNMGDRFDNFGALLALLVRNGHRWTASERDAIGAYIACAFPEARIAELDTLLTGTDEPTTQGDPPEGSREDVDAHPWKRDPPPLPIHGPSGGVR